MNKSLLAALFIGALLLSMIDQLKTIHVMQL